MLIKGVDRCPGLCKLVVHLVKIQGPLSTPSYVSERMIENILLDVSDALNMSSLLAAGSGVTRKDLGQQSFPGKELLVF